MLKRNQTGPREHIQHKTNGASTQLVLLDARLLAVVRVLVVEDSAQHTAHTERDHSTVRVYPGPNIKPSPGNINEALLCGAVKI